MKEILVDHPRQNVDTLIELIREGRDAAALEVLNANPALATAHTDREGQLHGAAPLHWAAHRNSAALCERLIELGTDVNRPTNIQRTPLDEALENKNRYVAEVLEKHGARTSDASD
ncbi:MAG: ankyrin repeat domain-containing protein [Pirellulaceae bacterium]|nr:ankyrin repeat domain-containing protein [Pirellulaceae bacterium]MDP6720486.1 ankyrin repeat domain-containing protein [Pirellulaceae bacterium]